MDYPLHVTLPPMKTKPPEIRRATNLLWVSLAVGLVKTSLQWPYLAARASIAFTGFILVFTLAIVGFLVWKIGQGRNWARIVFLVFSVLGFLPFLFVLRSEFARSPALGTLSVLQVGLQLFALLLIFTSPGKEWFHA
jgi:hypothetical protein